MAGYSLSAKVIGADELRAVFSKAREVVNREFGLALERTGFLIEGKAKEYAPRNYGNLAGSINTDKPTFLQDNITVRVGTNIHYAPHLEYGTRPHMPPLLPLREWAKRKLGNPNLAYAVARSIAKRGTQARNFFKRAREEAIAPHDANVRRALDNVVSFLAGK